MGTGIRNLWMDGYGSGVISAVAVLGGSCLIYWIASRKRRTLKRVEVVGTAFNKGYEVGQRQEREYREFMNERGENADYDEE